RAQIGGGVARSDRGSAGRHEVGAGHFVGIDIAAAPWSATRARDVFRSCSPLRCFSRYLWLSETPFVSIHLLYEVEGTGNITRAHDRKAQSDIESIPLANQDEWHKIVAIETF